MKLVYITSKTFPSAKVEPFIIKSASEHFNKILGKDFTLFIRGHIPKEFNHINTKSVKLPHRLKAASYFFWIPIIIFVNKWGNKETVFYSSDPYLLAILIFWRKIFRLKYLVCSEWHQLFDDWKDKYVASNSDFLVSTSKRLKQFIVSVSKVDPDKILVAYGGVDTSLFLEKIKVSKDEYRKSLKLPENFILVGYAGAFKAMDTIEKGLGTMIRALPYLDNKIKMIFVGGRNSEIDEYSNLAEMEGVARRCIFLGKQPFSRLVEYEMAMDILVIANPADRAYYRNYCFPFKVWEYMASGRPIVYSNLEIIDEVLSGIGTSFDVGDSASLAKAITYVSSNLGEKEKIARQNVISIEKFTWESRAQNIIDFINKK